MKQKNIYESVLQLLPYKKFLIAYSGGLDSHVLLHLMAQIRAENPKIKLQAIHVNHGLSQNAASWVKHCQKICKELKVHLIIKTLSLKKTPKKSLEAEARKLRYFEFSKLLKKDTFLLTAHNQNDQAETLLLQLFRGAGPKGLAAMPTKMEFASSFLLRPLLSFSRAELQKYAIENKLQWIEDESNTNLNFDRNFIRHKLMPVIQTRWPSVQETLARVARHCGEASELLHELAVDDLVGVDNTLFIKTLLELSPARQRNVLREWLQQLNFPIPSEIKLLQIQNEVLNAPADAKPLIKWEGTEIRRYQNYLYALKPLPTIDLNWEKIWELKSGSLLLPDNLGSLIAEKKQGSGYLKLPAKAKVTVRFRREGERCQPAGRMGSHPLKKLMQEWQIPPWQRNRIPLIYFNKQLVAVIGYCICEGYATNKKEEGFLLYRAATF